MILCMFFAIFAIIFGGIGSLKYIFNETTDNGFTLLFYLSCIAGGFTYILHHFNFC